MVTEVFADIYRMEIPLPRNPLRAINSYVVRGRDRWLVIDTGMNRSECLEVMRASLKALAIDLNRTDFFITHCHSDHIGLVSALKTGASQVFLNPLDAAVIRNPNLWGELAEAALAPTAFRIPTPPWRSTQGGDTCSVDTPSSPLSGRGTPFPSGNIPFGASRRRDTPPATCASMSRRPGSSLREITSSTPLPPTSPDGTLEPTRWERFSRAWTKSPRTTSG